MSATGGNSAQASSDDAEAVLPVLQGVENKKGAWSASEDEILREGVLKHGTGNWVELAATLHFGRTGYQCKHRWERTLDPTVKKGLWSESEDEALRQGVAEYGERQWTKISSALLPHRTVHQCKQRWEDVVDPTIKKGPWTEDELVRLGDLIAEHGPAWALIATYMDGRAANGCRNVWLAKKNRRGPAANIEFSHPVPATASARPITGQKRAAPATSKNKKSKPCIAASAPESGDYVSHLSAFLL